MARRIGAIFGMAILIGLALVLIWRVQQHSVDVPNAHDLTTVSVTAGEKITHRLS